MRHTLWALLALSLAVAVTGCLQAGDSVGESRPSGGTWSAESEYGVKPYPVTLHERISPGSEKTWAFEVRNEAPGSNPVEYNAACEGPFRVTVLGPDGVELQPKEPQMHCQAIDTKVLDTGDTLRFAWSWDGRVWGDGGTETPPKGTYTIRIGFVGYHDGNRDHVTDGAVGETTVTVEGR